MRRPVWLRICVIGYIVFLQQGSERFSDQPTHQLPAVDLHGPRPNQVVQCIDQLLVRWVSSQLPKRRSSFCDCCLQVDATADLLAALSLLVGTGQRCFALRSTDS